MASDGTSKQRKRRISGRAIGSTVFSIIDFDRDYYGDELEKLIREEVSNWLSRYDGYVIYGIHILEKPESNYLGTILVVRDSSLIGDSGKLVKNPDLWDIDIFEDFQGSFRFVKAKL